MAGYAIEHVPKRYGCFNSNDYTYDYRERTDADEAWARAAVHDPDSRFKTVYMYETYGWNPDKPKYPRLLKSHNVETGETKEYPYNGI